ncbi:hypothetical protein RO3G_03858 [Rhizopus delemar RA 99-880]|uniref:Uncharacterized protein n=1 Tax=Rhizopus delemar (strain RA 99-880 / ATCC MYA-4621 / FGSC 9543 / NRRL 43880) TaxID=246409 RepID=I1BSH3_RHIO9|nr:hypothetical protein RO3G_03858 [Rhizopus delemar RA 99-880]|eukprot:EIE79153.1 hypothetical protein RO3G_03858 [Rhizopus delemar RA 99-880]
MGADKYQIKHNPAITQGTRADEEKDLSCNY